jgi:hypothetical protein
MADVRDIIDFSHAQKPVEVMRSFSDIMAQKVHDAIQDKKIEVASAMFNGDTNPETIERVRDAAASLEQDEEAPEDIDDASDLDDELLDLTDEEWAALQTDDWDVEDDTNSEQNQEE